MGEGAFPTDSVLIKSDHPVEGEVENQSSNVQRNYKLPFPTNDIYE